ncbi:MAG: TRAP transporter small permease [Pseudomonadota bacterium]
MATMSQPRSSREETRLQRIVGAVSTVSGVVSAGLIFVSVLITCQMIWVRFVMNDSTIWQTEAVIYMMIAATLLGLPYVQRLRGHVNVDLIPGLLPPKARRVLAFLTLGLGIAVIGIMLWHSFELWHLAFERGWRSDTVWGVKLWIPYLAMPVGFGLYILQMLADLLAEISPAAED